MKISAAQIRPVKGSIEKNIEIHKKWIELAIQESSDLISFPELSLTGYEPTLASQVVIEVTDPMLAEFQLISDHNEISIALGLPTSHEYGIHISVGIFQPNEPIKVYSKQRLHVDEKPFFVSGKKQLIFEVGSKKIAPAICYESMQMDHAQKAADIGANIYLACVAKNQDGIEKAMNHYPKVSKKFSMPIVMSNSIGPCDNFISGGQSAIWNKSGELLGKLEIETEGLLTLDVDSEDVSIVSD